MNECADSIEDLLAELGVSYRKNYRRITGVCPIHCGDNQYAWNMYPDGDSVKGYWVCRTHNCHKKWGSNLIGFVRGVLSTTEKSITFDDAV